MANQGTMRINKVLTNIAQQYSNYQYIWNMLPNRQVKAESDSYYIYNNDRRIDASDYLRGNGSPAHEVSFDVSTSSYYIRERAVKHAVTDRDYDNVDAPPISLDRDYVEYLTDKLNLSMERETMRLIFTTTSFGNSKSLTSETTWNYHTTTSTPITDVLSATSYMLKQAGVKANTMICDIDTRDALKENPNIYGRIQYVQKAIVTEDLLASLFDLQKVLVGSAQVNGSKEGISDDLGGIWNATSTAWVGYLEPNPGIKTKSAMINLFKSGYGSPFRVKSYREEALDAKMIEVGMFAKGLVISSVSGYLFSNTCI